jgi:hypothetical protein
MDHVIIAEQNYLLLRFSRGLHASVRTDKRFRLLLCFS